MSKSLSTRAAAVSVWALGAALAIACAQAPSLPVESLEGMSVAERINELESAIRQDRRRIKAMLSEERGADLPPLYEDPELQEIAHRLPKLERELARLRDPPAGAESVPAGP